MNTAQKPKTKSKFFVLVIWGKRSWCEGTRELLGPFSLSEAENVEKEARRLGAKITEVKKSRAGMKEGVCEDENDFFNRMSKMAAWEEKTRPHPAAL